MVLKSYLIAPFNSGLINNVEPFLIPEDAFHFLTNAYIWRGRLRKRFGYSFIGETHLDGRLRIKLGTTDGDGDFPSPGPFTVPGTIFEIGQMFSVGTQVFTVSTAGIPAPLLVTGSATGTYDTTTGALIILAAAATTDVFFYPAQPVMGLRSRELAAVNNESTIGFDTQFAYERSGVGGWTRFGTAIWTGGDADFYWTSNYRGADPADTTFYVVNGVVADNIKFFSSLTPGWTTLRPDLGPGRFLDTAKIIVGFKDRLVVFNTQEEENLVQLTFKNRARFSRDGDPTDAATSWSDVVVGEGGFVDAPIEEAIITVEFIKDKLIVYFERSTWELVYLGRKGTPFSWRQLNNELGAESSFSIVGFDRGAIGIGNVGIHTCDGVNVKRIDQQIPEEVFNIHNGSDGPQRVYGIRDFHRELVYWTYPRAPGNPTFPTDILVWNYQNNSFAIFEDSFTCFGTFQNESDLTWAALGAEFGTWAQWNEPWGSGQSQSQFPFIVSGNQQGYTFIIRPDRSSNGQSLYITDMTANELVVINHNLVKDDYVLVEDAAGITIPPTSDPINGKVFKVTNADDVNKITLDTTFTGTYVGDGKLTRISQLNITSKEWNPGTPIGQQFRTPYIDFLLNRTTDGEVSVDYFIDSRTGDSIQDETKDSDVLLGNNTLLTRPEDNATSQPKQVRIWHRYFLQSEGMMLQIKIFMTDSQLRDLAISRSDFQMDALILYVEPQGRIIG